MLSFICLSDFRRINGGQLRLASNLSSNVMRALTVRPAHLKHDKTPQTTSNVYEREVLLRKSELPEHPNNPVSWYLVIIALGWN